LIYPVPGIYQTTPHQALLALSKRDHALAIVDPNSLKVIARAPVGPDPHEVIASDNGKTAYVSIYGGGRYHKPEITKRSPFHNGKAYRRTDC